MPLQTGPFEVRDFSGGLTDEHNTIIPKQYTAMDNLLFTNEGLPFSRYGSVVYNTAQLPSGNHRVSLLHNYNADDSLLAISNSKLYYDAAGTWTEIVGPTSNSAFPGTSASSHFQSGEYKRQIIVANDAGQLPAKIIKDDSRGWLAFTAGLPKMTTTCPSPFISSSGILAACIALANNIRTQTIAHFADASAHKTADSISGASIAAASTDLPTLITLTTTLLKAYTLHFNDTWGAGVYHRKNVTQTYGNSNQADETLNSIAAPTTLQECVQRVNDLRLRINTHQGHVATHYVFPSHFISASFQVGMYEWTGPLAVLDTGYIWYYVNLFKSLMNAHFNSGGGASDAHSTAKDLAHQITTANATTSDTLRQLINDLRIAYTAHEVDAELAVGWAYHIAQISPNERLAPGGIVYKSSYSASPYPDAWFGLQGENIGTSSSGVCAFMNDWRTIFNAHVSDWGTHYTTDPTSGGSTNSNSYDVNLISGNTSFTTVTYNYALVYKASYTVNGVLFETRSEPLYFETQGIPGISSGVLPIETQGLALTNIAPLINSTTYNYDTSNITIEVYRTIASGTTYFLAGTVANSGTSALSYTDTMKDADLINQQQLYTNGGVNPNTQPPAAKFFHVTNGCGYYGNYSGGSNQIVQTTPGTIDGAFGGNTVDLPQDVAGISSFRGIPVAWTATQTFRLEGQFDLLGNGSINAVLISNTIGLAAGYSPVSYDSGIIFASQDGFYLTDGYTLSKINQNWGTTYLNLIRTSTTQKALHGVFEKNEKRLWWCTNLNSTDNDQMFILDVNFPITQNSRFTTASNGTDFSPSAIGYFGGQIIRGDSRGYVFKHDPSYTSDPKVNTGAAASGWTTRWIPYTHQSPFFDFGSLMQRKFNPRVNVKAKNLGNLSLQVNLFTDDNTSEVSALNPIRYRGGSDIIEQRMHTPAGYLRCRNRAIQMVNAKVIITSSDVLGLATLNHAAKTLTLAAGSFPGDQVDQVITFSTDSYVAEWTINAQAGGVITITDAGGTLPINGSYKWEIKGYPKDEKFQLISYAIHTALIGRNQPVAGAATTGANA